MAEATETTETQAPETTEPIAPEPTTPPEEGQEPQAPDVGEALQQMGERLQSFESRLPEAEQEETDLYAALTGFEQPEGEGEQQPTDPYAQQEEGAEDETAQLQQMLSQAVQEQIQPYILQQEQEKRENGIRSLADQHPRLNEPEVIDAVSERLQQQGLMPANGFPPDPQHVLTYYRAYEAEAAASAGEPDRKSVV
jgi:hypothetical protein